MKMLTITNEIEKAILFALILHLVLISKQSPKLFPQYYKKALSLTSQI